MFLQIETNIYVQGYYHIWETFPSAHSGKRDVVEYIKENVDRNIFQCSMSYAK